ncbi:hypothetical protein EIN_227770 [Entamoeba invadens IP1]|uniref:Major facilitator superfamily (MFS) profile domain-containing protein n=1 Tax=Entamoeba invadens IP1 TaxID=370355 RepID=A0A0A1U2V1_ENTIV|nr:hypothetical protein EIN_227770 [Entamoeba invadens IP1]ELP88354.1 hypothetical protein EIN_227770 [Entamoeba invadens IP1]|eukprot:XP_004255125.1 hypothetical protein EIN_227770 [Entamoeba invadens IP1]
MANCLHQTKRFIQHFNVFNYYFGGFVINMATYFCWLILPYLIKEQGGSSFMIGLADCITFGLCGLLCPVIGLFLDKKWFPIDDIIRIGFVLQALCGVSIGIFYVEREGSLLPLFFLLLQQSFALAFFWSICEYMLSNEVYKGETNKKLSIFSVSWSLGKAIGFVLGGPMKSAFGNTFSLYFSSVIVMIAFVTFPRMPRHRSSVTRKEAKLRRLERRYKKEYPECATEESLKFSNNEIMKLTTEDSKSSRKPYYFTLYYLNNLVIHFTVYGAIAVFGNQYIDFADAEKITLQGVSEDTEIFISVFLGVLYFSQTIFFFIFGLFHHWQYVQTLNIIVQIIIAGMATGMIFLRNGWVLCCLAIVIGCISAYEIQSIILYSLNASDKARGKVLGLTECVGELTCSLCPLFSSLIVDQLGNREYALYFCIGLQVVGLFLCSVIQLITKILEIRRKITIKKNVIDNGKELEEIHTETQSTPESKTKPTQQVTDVSVPLTVVHSDDDSSEESDMSESSNDSEESDVETESSVTASGSEQGVDDTEQTMEPKTPNTTKV